MNKARVKSIGPDNRLPWRRWRVDTRDWLAKWRRRGRANKTWLINCTCKEGHLAAGRAQARSWRRYLEPDGDFSLSPTESIISGWTRARPTPAGSSSRSGSSSSPRRARPRRINRIPASSSGSHITIGHKSNLAGRLGPPSCSSSKRAKATGAARIDPAGRPASWSLSGSGSAAGGGRARA